MSQLTKLTKLRRIIKRRSKHIKISYNKTATKIWHKILSLHHDIFLMKRATHVGYIKPVEKSKTTIAYIARVHQNRRSLQY